MLLTLHTIDSVIVTSQGSISNRNVIQEIIKFHHLNDVRKYDFFLKTSSLHDIPLLPHILPVALTPLMPFHNTSLGQHTFWMTSTLISPPNCLVPRFILCSVVPSDEFTQTSAQKMSGTSSYPAEEAAVPTEVAPTAVPAQDSQATPKDRK